MSAGSTWRPLSGRSSIVIPDVCRPRRWGEYRRRVSRAIEEFVRWVEDPGSYAFRPAGRIPGRDAKPRSPRRVRGTRTGGKVTDGAPARFPAAMGSRGG